MRIKKTLNIFLLLFFILFVTSCFNYPGLVQDNRGSLPEGNYAGYIYAGERKVDSTYCGRIGCTYEKSNYNINDNVEIVLSIYYGFIIDELIDFLNNKNITKFNYQIDIYFDGKEESYFYILKEEELNIEDIESLYKYTCTKEIYEHQTNGSGVEGCIYKYSYASNGFFKYVINKDKLIEMNQKSNLQWFTISFGLDFDFDGFVDEYISELHSKIFINDTIINIEGIKYDSLR